MGADDGGGVAPDETPMSQRLTNDDFRRLLMTPRVHGQSHGHSTGHGDAASKDAKDGPKDAKDGAKKEGEDRGELRRKKKSYYAALKKKEDDKLAELAEKYRDRARERRDNANPDYVGEEAAPLPNASDAYRAVAPDLKSGLDAKERRRRVIQESKFLGGDMEHTHLVKGLDYALLQKVRSEIHSREVEQERRLEELADAGGGGDVERRRGAPDAAEAVAAAADEEIEFATQLGRDVYGVIAAHRSERVERNETFAPGRTAYVIDLDDDQDTDIPTTLVRSRAEAPSTPAGQPTLTTNDIVIDKLAQVLAYLRHGARRGLKGRKNKERPAGTAAAGAAKRAPIAGDPVEDSIYGDIGDYVPTRGGATTTTSDPDRKKKGGPYFDGPSEKDEPSSSALPVPKLRDASLLSKLAAEPEGYAECYPGLREMDDAIEDSDDEADYTKMDAGNKKGPVGRWDFDTQEEYSAYMNQREALPKAAFQYGVKTTDGRKTRKTNKEKNDKAELDREWQQIQNIIQKRKTPRAEKSADEPEFKVPKY